MTIVNSMSDDIVPDDKNWTWVLERRCEDCGFDASSFDAAISGIALRDLAVRWAAVLASDAVTVRPRPGVWSPLEYGCHVRDVFRKFDERVRLMLEEDDPAFENWDQDRTAVEDKYGEQDPAVVAAQVVAAGSSLATRFESVGPDQWRRRGFRSDGSVFTIRSLAKYLMHDPVHHLWDVGAQVPMFDAKTHRTLAMDANNSVWDFLDKPADELSETDAEEMTRRAYAAAFHWQRAAGSVPANEARASWLLSRVWVVRGNGAEALLHARRCLAVCESAGLEDFDLAYAYEALARSYACMGDMTLARSHHELARSVPIADPEDASTVQDDLTKEPWFGLQDQA
jgi:hypothetical protein